MKERAWEAGVESLTANTETQSYSVQCVEKKARPEGRE